MIAEILSAALGTVGFSLLFGVPRKFYFNCALIGGAGWFGYKLALILGCGTGVAAFIGTLILALLSRFAAVYRQCPTTVFLIAGIGLVLLAAECMLMTDWLMLAALALLFFDCMYAYRLTHKYEYPNGRKFFKKKKKK